ncbi:MAG TPA: hypothetical protein VG692_13445 [Gemmatimonadales bacterium]|nr:hypothetical protein [Gemmatimonadales bacterium]
MPPSVFEILAAFRSGAMSAEDAARLLLPLLQTSGRPAFEPSTDLAPVLEALQRLAGPAPSAPRTPLTWDSPHRQRLPRVAADFWAILQERRLATHPQCLRYAFTVRSREAASALEDWIMDHSDHGVTLELPESFEHRSGQVVGLTEPKVLSRDDLDRWVAFLQAIPPVPDASLSDLGIASPQ